MVDHRVQLGDEFRIAAFSSVVVDMRARVLVEFDNGRLREFNVKLTTTSDRLASSATFGNLEADGRVVRAVVARITPGTVKRGQCYVILAVRDRNGVTVDQLALDYLYESNNLALDRYRSALSGRGFLRWLPVAVDEDGDNDTTLALAATNARRRLKALVLYYFCSTDVANRTMILVLQKQGLAQPTGYGSGAVDTQWQTPTLALTASEDGSLNVGESMMFQSQNDDGVLTFSNNSTVPHPLPLWVVEDDLVELFVNVSTGQEADKYSCYALVEEWIDV